jgi:hypothetical protein
MGWPLHKVLPPDGAELLKHLVSSGAWTTLHQLRASVSGPWDQQPDLLVSALRALLERGDIEQRGGWTNGPCEVRALNVERA